MSGELGRASLDLDVELREFERKVAAGEHSADGLGRTLLKTAGTADLLDEALSRVKLGAGQAAESRVSAGSILAGVRGVSDESREAAREIDRVKLGPVQAAETVAAGDVIDRKLHQIRNSAVEASAAMDSVTVSGAAAGAASGGGLLLGGTSPSLLAAGIGAGALLAPSAGPAALGLLAAIPVLAGSAGGALGVLALAFQGVGKAIGGDKKAFDDLSSSQQQFVLLIRSLDEWFGRLKQIAAQSLFPGLTAGLKAALSPGTLNAITTAVVQVGRALGAAGAAWGKYFGSARFQHLFGPLMQAGARNIVVLSDTLLRLFDALGVIGRAAIPFTNWLVTAIDRGARFVDTWLRAKDATGQLSGAMREARTSLTLVAKLFGALLNAVAAFGQAVYPISKGAVKLLTDGLNALAGIIRRNQGDIRAFGRGALYVIATGARAAADGIGVLWHGLERLIGHKGAIIAVITAIGVALLAALGPYSLAIGGAIIAIGLIKEHWTTIKTFFKRLGREIVHAFQYVWYLIKKGALKAALGVIEPFSHLPSFLGGWARDAKDAMQSQLDKLHAPNMNWSGEAHAAGAATGAAWSDGFKGLSGPAGPRRPVSDGFEGLSGPAGPPGHPRKHHRRENEPKPGTHAWYMKYLGYDPTKQPTFGPDPGFTTNTTTAAAAAKKHHVTAAERMQLHLQYVLDQAKVAVEHAQQGSKAWDRAVHAEEKALKAEIRYWDKRAHNRKLSVEARDKALREELKYQKQLKALLAPIKQAAVANEAQFLATFNAIQHSFGPNTFPTDAGGGKKTDTHLYDLKEEARESNRHLRVIRDKARFPGSRTNFDAALAATS